MNLFRGALAGGAKAIVRDRTIELDFVRGIAIIAVMGYHFRAVHTGYWFISAIEYPLTHFGREGVNLFFTLSGFLVGGLLLRQYAQTGRVDARRFIVRRIFKIWPAYYVLILFHVLAGRHPASTFLWQNLAHLQNYFGTSITQTWSLAVEEHFYLFLPALLLLFAHWRVRANTILGVLGAICLVVLIARSAVVAQGDLDAAFAYTQYRIDSLLAGVILAVLYWMKPETYRRFAQRKGLLIALIAMLVAWLVLVATRHFAIDESIGYTIQAIGYVALIVFVLEYSAKVRRSLVFRAIAWIGVYSYGIYLWHSIALAPGEILIHQTAALGVPPLAAWAIVFAAQAAIAIGVGYVTTRLIEFPFLLLRNALFPARQQVLDVAAAKAPAREKEAESAPQTAAKLEEVPGVGGVGQQPS
ncbi:acyltransferase [Trinickia terrae]|uniref:Acyltransferase n=1 Tax=Trinickia terrae TaxID=2571161 RepID=A0A4U1ICK6_9BURK|nr:acyltransferase [Trinickia terrae]TKC91175.1 acyltransferase [Trinickia terrae]